MSSGWETWYGLNLCKETDTNICANTVNTLNGQFEDQKLKHDDLLIQTI